MHRLAEQVLETSTMRFVFTPLLVVDGGKLVDTQSRSTDDQNTMKPQCWSMMLHAGCER
jgi:hypothetical protein